MHSRFLVIFRATLFTNLDQERRMHEEKLTNRISVFKILNRFSRLLQSLSPAKAANFTNIRRLAYIYFADSTRSVLSERFGRVARLVFFIPKFEDLIFYNLNGFGLVLVSWVNIFIKFGFFWSFLVKIWCLLLFF